MPRLSGSQVKAVVIAAGFHGDDVPIAVGVAMAESGGNTGATHRNTNGSTDYGLFQINSIHSDVLARGNWRNPVDNAKMAYAVKSSSGWNAWVTYKSGAYKAPQLWQRIGDIGLSLANPALGFLTGGTPISGGLPSVPSMTGALGGASKVLGTVTSRDFWIRAGQIVAALVLLVVGLLLFLGKDVAKTAVKVKGAVI